MPKPIAAAMVKTTCARPRPNTMRRIDLSWARENSSPMENIRKTTPNSASAWVAGLSSARASAWGPINTPTAR